MADEQLPKLMTPAELSKVLGVPVGTIYAWRCKGLIPCIQLPGMAPRFIAADVLAWLQAGRKGGQL